MKTYVLHHALRSDSVSRSGVNNCDFDSSQKEVEALKAEAAKGTSQHADAIIATKNMAEASAATQRKEVEQQRDMALQVCLQTEAFVTFNAF